MLIAFEGLDGAGKRTQSQLLERKAREAGLSTGFISFPRYGETRSATLIQDYLNGLYGELYAIDPHFPSLLYALDRLESREIILGLLKSASLTIVDRYVSSNLAYQGARVPERDREEFITWLASVEYELFGLPAPELTVYLAVKADIARSFVSKKGPRQYTQMKEDLHERDAEFLRECGVVYDYLCEHQCRGKWIRIECIDSDGAMRSPIEINSEIWTTIMADYNAAASALAKAYDGSGEC